MNDKLSDVHDAQSNLSVTDALHPTIGSADTASFEPTSTTGAQFSSSLLDQQAAKSIGKEQI